MTKKYIATSNNEYIHRVYEKMQKQVERVKQLDGKLNTPSETVKRRNEVHKDIKDSIRYIKGMLEGSLLSPFTTDKANAEYICKGLEGLVDLKSMTSIAAITNTIATIRHTIDDDGTLANALMELDLMDRVEILYKQGEEFKQLVAQKSIENVTAPDIDKAAIRKESAKTLKLLFDAIVVNHSITEEEVWMEMAEKVRELVTEATIEK
ncbi:MAG TPA: DUF6261 family protein [Thermoclostridium sp.]|nr:DUF6261 family protein [Thermoclostridium sp.]